MPKIIKTIFAGFVGFTAAFVVCFAFAFYSAKRAQSQNENALNKIVTTPLRTPEPEVAEVEVKVADVKSVDIDTVYTGYFDKSDKCSKTYNEYFGNEDGMASTSSPCTIKFSVSRDGRATRVVEISRWDKATKQKRVVEKTEAIATVTPAQFEALATVLVTNDAFKAWRDGTSLYTSNCKISVHHAAGVKSPMSSVGPSTTAYLPMVEAFKKLEKELVWK